MNRKPKRVLFRRRREGRTNYNKRLKLLLSGKQRLVVRFTGQRVIAQIVNFTEAGDKIVAGVDSFALKKMGWPGSCKNIPAAYLTGLMIGKAGVKAGSKQAILDTGHLSPLKQGKLFAFLKGVLDGGLEVPHGEKDVFPGDDILSGKGLKTDTSKFDDVKGKIIG
jgi:large subunit ribosomal protein L18